MSSSEERGVKAVVRMYSIEVNDRLPIGHPAYDLGRILSSDGPGDLRSLVHPWRHFFENSDHETPKNPVTEDVLVEARKLRDKWMEYHDNCSDEDRLDLTTVEPTMEGIVGVVDAALAVWNKKRRKGWRGEAASNFHKFCGTLDSHSNMLGILPKENMYVTIFSGSLTTIIKASVNHERIAEGLSQALCEIGDLVRDCSPELRMFPTEQMQKLVSGLYSHIFLLLTSVMDWIMQKKYKRLLDSFNEDFNRKFKDEIDTIKQHAERIRSLAAQASRAESRVSRLTVEDTSQELKELRRDLRVGLEAIARVRADLNYQERIRQLEEAEARRNRELLGERSQHLAGLLKELLQQETGRMLAAPWQVLTGSPSPSPIAPVQQEASDAGTMERTIINSRHFEDFFHRDRVRISSDGIEGVTVPAEALQRLSEWSDPRHRRAAFLWLEGEPSQTEDLENAVTVFAAQFINLVGRIKVPVVSYFCELRRGEGLRPRIANREQQGMLSLGYAIVRQMVELLLPRFSTAADLSETRLTGLDGTAASWHELLNLLDDLVPLMPDLIYVIIDGLHWLNDRSTDDMGNELIAHLRKSSGKLRVLFATSGMSGTLERHLESHESVRVDREDLEGGGLAMNPSDLVSVS